jgi:hypothetical protein
MPPWSGLGALVRMELRRGLLPLARAMIVPVLLGLSASLRSRPNTALLSVSLAAAMILASTIVALQVGRDRDDGTLPYLSSMPIMGETLAGARFLASAIFTVGVALLLAPLGGALFPEIPWTTTLRVACLACAVGSVLGWALIGLLARFNRTTVLSWPLVGLIAVGFVLDHTGLGARLAAWLAAAAQGSYQTAVAGVAAVLSWLGLVLLGIVAFAAAARGLQPNGGAASTRAREALRRYARQPE